MKLRLVAALGLSAALLLTACGEGNGDETAAPQDTAVDQTEDPADTADETDEPGDDNGGSAGGDLSGELRGMGASSMRVSQEAWLAAFMDDNPGVTVSYAAEGSGAGRGAMEDGSAEFGGSDAAYAVEDNVAGAFGACSADSTLLNLPVYVSPIAIIYNLDGVDELNLDATTVASIFKGDIILWNDPAIAATNEGVELPDEYITVVHRSDTSGTTENFADWLSKIAPDVWDAEVSGDWPYSGQGGAQTDGVYTGVTGGNGTIGYVDASAAEGISVAQVESEGEFYGPDAEAAAAVVEASPQEEGREGHDLGLELDRTAAGYGGVLVAYLLLCQNYDDPDTAELVKAYASWIVSEEGQSMSEAQSGAAPLSEGMRDNVQAAIDSINA